VRECAEEVSSLRGSPVAATLRLLVQPIAEALEGRWTTDGLLIEKVYNPGVGQACGE
jgi:hypothetical protein